jgi:hypothetical protein
LLHLCRHRSDVSGSDIEVRFRDVTIARGNDPARKEFVGAVPLRFR